MLDSTEIQLRILDQLSQIQSQGAATAQKITSLEDRLFNGGSGVIHTVQQDIEEIKEDRRTEAKWERIHNVLHYSIGPLLVTGHAIARKLGLNI